MLFLLAFFLSPVAASTFLDLNGPWSFCSSNGTCHKGNVPGDVFTDLFKADVIPHPLYANNSLQLGWVSRENWSYSRSFSLSQEQIQLFEPALIFEGIDTVARVYLNGKRVLESDNQFRRYVVDVKDLLQEMNTLEVKFDSPVFYAQQKNDEYTKKNSHQLPPVCPPPVYHGECHPNFIRKAQYSFSWDWGPSIPTVGLWKPVKLLLAKLPTPIEVSWITEKDGHIWRLLGSLEYRNVPGENHCTVEVEGLGSTDLVLVGTGKRTLRKHQFTIEIPEEKVELWWPATEGTPKLYKLTVNCQVGEIKEEVGFRTVELNQDLVDEKAPQKGRHFYFKVNGRPIFLKGSNWIPASMFPGENVDKKVDFLLDSAVEANMNVLRVWGGGVYESEYFYRLANRKGILLWQDMMFACALYPTDKRFLTTVAEEIEEQIFRLRKHPSILVFAGNNENEVAIRTHWWSVSNYTEDQQVEDYIALYADIIAPIVDFLDPSRPFLLSSPSNGRETEQEGGVSQNPGDILYGDIHFYNEFIDLWQDFNYLTPRCASEYGVQSIPFKSTMTKWIDEKDWYYLSPVMMNRQHHPGGLATNPMMVFQHFPLSSKCTIKNIQKCEKLKSSAYMERYAYYSQAHQALAYKIQTEHYRRFRGKLTEDGEGNTMCALYWQLNDVWAAPTWSSVDFNLQWKMAHYEAKRFFAQLIVILYSTKWNSVAVSVVNDGKAVDHPAKLTIFQYEWGSAFDPVYKETKSVEIPQTGSIDVTFEKSQLTDVDNQYVISLELTDQNGTLLAPASVLLPDQLYDADLYKSGTPFIEEFKQIDSLTYSLILVTDDISPLTWLSLQADILFWFSDNGFTMVSPRKDVRLHLREPHPVQREMISVCNIKTCGLQ